MKLTKVQIKNFRSIKDVEIDFDPQCRVLVGINESGKSNILKALALMGSDNSIDKKTDLREVLPDEDKIEEAYVRFVFDFEEVEINTVYKTLSSKILSNVENPDIISIKGENKNIRDFCLIPGRQQGIYSANIISGKKLFQYWSFPENYQLISGWKKPTKTVPADFEIKINEQSHKLADCSLVREGDIEVNADALVKDDYLENATIEDLSNAIGNIIISITRENLPNMIFWQYNDANLLPTSVNTDEFATNPNSCMPLKHMFALAGVDEVDIEKDIKDNKEKTDNGFQNYLNGIVNKTTAHFRNTWQDYKTVQFSLTHHGKDSIAPGIKEINTQNGTGGNTYDFSKRSDGFKRFVTFLLMISVNEKTEDLRNTLLLIDEPEIGLHPSGARYFRDELIRISKTNYVVYSTHSIFMIDTNDIDRHDIVKKENEITQIKQAEGSFIRDEEVLYNALNYSIFSILEENNILFEGWYDKHLFKVALDSCGDNELQEKFKKIGITHAKGVSSIQAITPVIELAKRKCIVISDCDAPAKEKKKDYEAKQIFGKWKTYKDIDKSIQAITGEDFIKNNYIVEKVNSVLSKSGISAFDAEKLLPKSKKLESIRSWLKQNIEEEANKKDVVNIINEIKASIFDNLKFENLDMDEYQKLLNGISFK